MSELKKNNFANGNSVNVKIVNGDSIVSAQDLPVWLNEIYIQNVLQTHFNNEKLKVKKLEVQHCGGKGESYVSAMFRVGTYFNAGENPEATKFSSFILKTSPKSELAIEKLGPNSYDVQKKEMKLYKEVFPEFRRILESINEDSSLFPKVVAIDKINEVFVMEDLGANKFVMADRVNGMDLNHTRMALRKLARMHAASVIVHGRDSSAFKRFDTGIFSRKIDAFHVMFESLCNVMVDEVSSWVGYEYYAKKLRNVNPSMIKNVLRAFDCDDGDFNVLTHGDFWTNNMMFQYDDAGKLIDAVLIDFQFASFRSPAIDLIYFLFTSTIDELRQEKTEELIQYYYYELSGVLKKFDYDMGKFPTLQGFQIQVLKKYFIAFTSFLLCFPVMIAQEKDADFESLMKDDARAMGFKKRVFRNQRFQAVAKKILPMLDRRGILDEL